jgi:general secretion pathway protein K
MTSARSRTAPPIRTRPTPSRPIRDRAGDQRGFALLIVLWTLVLLTLLGATITEAGRSEARLASNLTTAAATEAAADGAVAAAKFHLITQSNQHWAADGSTHVLKIGGVTAQVTITDDDGKLDPNQSPPGLIASLLRQLGVDDTTAASLANAIVDWRSPTDTGFAVQYQAGGREFGPPHQPFLSAGELGLVVGMTPALTRKLAPFIDPYIESTPNPDIADPVMAAAIDDAVKRDHLTMDPASTDGPVVVAITAVARGGGDAFVRHALVRFDQSASPPFQTLEWRQG